MPTDTSSPNGHVRAVVDEPWTGLVTLRARMNRGDGMAYETPVTIALAHIAAIERGYERLDWRESALVWGATVYVTAAGHGDEGGLAPLSYHVVGDDAVELYRTRRWCTAER
jgi:hypothetical protein